MKYYFNHEFAYRRKSASPEAASSFQGSSLQQFLDLALAKTPFSAGARALVLGCGQGGSCEYLLQKGFAPTGLDISPSAILLAEAASEQRGFSIDYRIMDIVQMDSLPAFDLILDDHCLHCLVFDQDRKSYFSHVYSHLKPGGKLILETMVYDHHLQWGEGLLLDDQKILWCRVPEKESERYLGVASFQHHHYVPFRRLQGAFELEQELVGQGFFLEYFYFCPHLKMEIPGNETIPVKNWPSLLRVVASRKNNWPTTDG